jgi:hypothetical protein
MNERVEDRLRRALQARAEQVTPESLPPSGSVRSLRPHRAFWGPQLLVAAAVTAVVAGVVGYTVISTTDRTVPGPATPPRVVTGSTCEREHALVEQALKRGGLPADVDGDGEADQVVVAVDENGRPGCRSFLGVRTDAGTTYSTAMPDATREPLPFPPEVIGVPQLGDVPGAEVVVDTQARADGAYAQLYTLTGSGLTQVQVPGTDDDSILVEGGGVTAPSGADCRSNGDLLLSNAQVRGPRTFEVTQQVYSLQVDRLVQSRPPTTSDVAADDLTAQFPEFSAPHFGACNGAVRRAAR